MSAQPLVLVADDEPRITKLVSLALTAEGFRVVAAAPPTATDNRSLAPPARIAYKAGETRGSAAAGPSLGDSLSCRR